MSHQIIAGTPAPDFRVSTKNNKNLRLSQYLGQPIWLVLYRYLGCPLCQYHLMKIIEREKRIMDAQMAVIIVFESAKIKMPGALATKRFPEFSLVEDSERKIYQLYGSEEKTSGIVRPSVAFRLAQALLGGARQCKIEGKLGRIPAHFLIDEEGMINTAYYGNTISDQIPWSIVDPFIDGFRNGRWAIPRQKKAVNQP